MLLSFSYGAKRHKYLERLNHQIGSRNYAVRIFPNVESGLRLVGALAVETREK